MILGLESATAQVGCAIGGHEGVLASSHSARGKRHAENLTPAIDFVCRQARVDLSEISCVAVDNGPGLFTGLRVGVAAGRLMAGTLRLTTRSLHGPPPARRPAGSVDFGWQLVGCTPDREVGPVRPTRTGEGQLEQRTSSATPPAGGFSFARARATERSGVPT